MDKDIDHPDHYTGRDIACPHCGGAIECIDITRKMSFLEGNVTKYLWRHPFKGMPLKDLKKARWYLDQLIKETDDGT